METITDEIQKLTVLYDAHCKFCIGCANWVNEQPLYFEIELVPLQSDEALKRYPSLRDEINATRFIAVDDQGGVYFDTDARLMVLFALQNFRQYALRLADPRYRKWTDRVFELISDNRNHLGVVFGNLDVAMRRKEEEALDEAK